MTTLRTQLMAATHGVFLMLCMGAQASAATLTVTSLADDGSAGTLRSQVAAAAPGDTINFGVTGTIALSSQQSISISKDLTITGPGASSLAVKGVTGNASLFNFSGGVVAISGITMRDGRGETVAPDPLEACCGAFAGASGGAIFMTAGTVTLTSCVLMNNQVLPGLGCAGFSYACAPFAGNGGAIYQHGGSLSLVSCSVNGNSAYSGGAIAIDGGSLSISKSAISANNAVISGGGIYNQANITITDSTINGNQVYDADPAFPDTNTYAGGNPVVRGAGIMQSAGAMTITNCTISGNSCKSVPQASAGGVRGGGGILLFDGTLTVASSTITNNSTDGGEGGGINARFSGTSNLTNTIVAGNFCTATPAGRDFYGDFYGTNTSGDYNVLQNFYAGSTFGTHNIFGQPALLAPLANNGGPTLTHALLSGSPAYDAGDPTFDPTTRPYDQRGSGFPRVLNGRLDIGAIESPTQQSGTSFIVNTLADHDDGICDVDCTLREAVHYAWPGATITFSVAGTITLLNGDMLIADRDLAISGPTTAPGITISGNHASRIFTVYDPGGSLTAHVAFSYLTLTAGDGASPTPTLGDNGSGGAIANFVGRLTQVAVDHCTFTGNDTSLNAGAISNTAALTVTNSTFSGNTANVNGGAIRSTEVVTVTNSTFFGNSAKGNGGAIGTGADLTIANCTFSGNHADVTGGAINKGNAARSLDISNSIFADNTALTTAPNISGVVTSGDYDLVDNTSGATLPGTHNITGQSPSLGPLGNYGGPTQTMPLLSGSPAIDAGDPAFDTTITPYDQRGIGYPRKYGSAIDIGAFEQQPANVTLSLTGSPMAEAGGVATITATLSNVSAQTVTVNLAFSGTATITSDYTTSASSIVIPAGSTSGFITLTAASDAIYETAETIVVDATTVINGTLATPQQVTATIIDDDAPPALAINNVAQAEGTGGTTNFVFTVTLAGATTQTVTVNYATADGAASAPADYAASSGTLTFTPGTFTQTITVPVVADALNEANENFTVTLSGATVATIASATGTGTIQNDDAAPTLAINNVTQAEGDSGTTNFVFTVTLTGPTAQTVTVNYATANGTATAPSDYSTASGTLTFAPGTLTQTITVPVSGDTVNEMDETFTVGLSGATVATVTTATGIGTITNDDPAPTLAINNVTQAEGTGGTTNFVFTVTLTGSTAQPVTVNYVSADGTATAPADYATTNGTLTFAPGTLAQTITVPVVADALNEPDETFTIALSGATVATITTATGTGTITNDDAVPALSINSPSQSEGNGGTSAMNFVVTLSAASGQTVTVSYTTSNGSAIAGSDYTLTAGTLTFAPGTTVQTIPVPINGDTVNEADETFAVTLSSPSNATVTTAMGIGTIVNDDAVPALAISSSSQVEGNSGTSPMTFVVTLSAASGQTVTVSYATADVTTVAGVDYTATSGVLTFAPGVISQTIAVAIAGDTVFEGNETFTVTLSSPSNATITTATGTGTILDDDGAPTLSISSASQSEGDSGTTNLSFVVTLSPAAGQPVTVDYATADGTATAGSDYTAASGTLTFAPGTTTHTIVVPIIGDAVNEADEIFTVNLTSAVNATVATASGTGTIVNDDALPALSIGNVSQPEGNSGATSMNFVVTLSAPSGQMVTVDYASANGTATAGSDYTATSGTLTFAPGVLTQTIAVPVSGDSVSEPDETFTVSLSAAINATIGAGTATGTIVNDDGAPTLSIDSPSQVEGNSGSTAMNFTVTLSAGSGQPVTVNYATADGTSTAGSDYFATIGTLTFAPGVLTQKVAVQIIGDVLNEPNETFTLTLSAPANATLAVATGTGTIVNDDGAPTLSINSPSQVEGNSGTTAMSFTVTMSAASAQPVTVNYATANGTATAGSDYAATSGTLTFAPGVLTQTIAVKIIGDALNEPNETFTVTLSSPANATLAAATGIGTIVNDDGAPSLSIDSPSQAEGNSGTTAMSFTVTLSAASAQPVTVNYASSNGTATAGSDYTATSGTLTFAPGVVTQTVAVPIIGDVLNEPNETFTLTLSSPANATLATATGTGTIVNDDGAPTLSINSASQAEGNSGAAAIALTVTLSPAAAQTVTVNYATSNGTATAGSDYTAASGTLTFAPGLTTQTIAVPILGDTTMEPNETFLVTLSAPVNATIASAIGTATIINDDAVAAPSIANITPRTGGAAQVVTITGTGLSGATSVTFGGVAGAIIATSATSITVTTPAHANGAVDVVVTTPGGTATAVNGFAFSAAPVVPIPTLSEWMLLALIAMLGMIALFKLES